MYAELRDKELWTVAVYAPDGVRIVQVDRFRQPEDAEHYAEQHQPARVFAPTFKEPHHG